ncbi:mannose receptor [Penaeus vannamei]|uniref:Mannose receptor n=1 Tax=Penaeus vannamei TaxID=6689 RepID=A0A3R7PFW8_PENVA|nr:mannose receptor [Penaeus vannamei]
MTTATSDQLVTSQGGPEASYRLHRDSNAVSAPRRLLRMGPLSQVAALLLMLSAAHSVKLRQECDIGLQVGCPSEADEQPWVSCSRVNCSVSAKRVPPPRELRVPPPQRRPPQLPRPQRRPPQPPRPQRRPPQPPRPQRRPPQPPRPQRRPPQRPTTRPPDHTTTATEPPTTVPSCPEGWTAFESSCFLVSDESGTYGDGWNFCRARGGVLASVRSQAEQDFVTGLLPGSVWIGLSDGVAEGAFAWADASTSSYTKSVKESLSPEAKEPRLRPDARLLPGLSFYPGEPSGSGGHPDEDCVELRAAFGFAWNDEWCETRNRYLCRIDV